MGDLLQTILPQLKPGYKVLKAAGKRGLLYHIIGPDGKLVRDDSGQPVGFLDKSGPSAHRNSIANLRRAGCLQPRQKRTNTSKDYEKVAHDPAPRPAELASAILNDPRATPRERKMAREYLNTIQRLNDTSHALQLANVRNDELATLIRRYIQERGTQSASPTEKLNQTQQSSG